MGIEIEEEPVQCTFAQVAVAHAIREETLGDLFDRVDDMAGRSNLDQFFDFVEEDGESIVIRPGKVFLCCDVNTDYFILGGDLDKNGKLVGYTIYRIDQLTEKFKVLGWHNPDTPDDELTPTISVPALKI